MVGQTRRRESRFPLNSVGWSRRAIFGWMACGALGFAVIWAPGAALAAPPVDTAATARPPRADRASKTADDRPTATRPTDTQSTAAVAEETPPSDWNLRVHAALKRESSARGAEQEQAIRDLVALYRSLEKPDAIDQDERTELRGLVRNRLTRVAARLNKELARAGEVRATKSRPVPAAESAATAGAPASTEASAANNRSGKSAATVKKTAVAKNPAVKKVEGLPVLAQQIGGGAPIQPAPANDTLGELAALIEHVIPADWENFVPAARQVGQVLAQQAGGVGLGGQNGGAFGQGGGQAGGAQGGVFDYGRDLVELIQTTIAPNTWEINGGNGTIMYYQQQRAIVVRQTDDVHGDLEGVLGKLRAAN